MANTCFVALLPLMLSAIFAALTAVFAKLGLKNVNSDLATAMQNFIVILFAPLDLTCFPGKHFGNIHAIEK